MATLDHFYVIGDSQAHGSGPYRTATEARMKLAECDEHARKVSSAIQDFIDSLIYQLAASWQPDICGAGFSADWLAQINRKLRKRHARYRRGREGVRPRHRGKRQAVNGWTDAMKASEERFRKALEQLAEALA